MGLLHFSFAVRRESDYPKFMLAISDSLNMVLQLTVENLMLNMVDLKDAKGAEDYFGKSDSGYYIKDDEMHREWGGKGAAMLGLTGTPTQVQLRRLLHGLDPHHSEQLTAKLIDARTAGNDFTASVPKDITTLM